MPTPVLFSWSGGKDSALALHALLQQPEWEVVALLTTISSEYRRVSHHGIREELLDEQAAAIGLPLYKLWLPTGSVPCTNADYEALVGAKLA
jgi:diphthamide synthase (EF-2-diphthine--ammonia ligase)